MNKKLKIFFLFLLLSMTPFIRGCGETFGFPLPAFVNILHFNKDYDIAMFPQTVANIINSLKYPATLIFLAVNLLAACLFALSVLRNNKYQRWQASFLDSLSIHLAAVWLMVVLLFMDVSQPILKKIVEFYGTCFGHYFLDIPVNIAYKLGKEILEPYNILYIDIMSRAWFITVTAALAVAIYLLRRIIARFSKAGK